MPEAKKMKHQEESNANNHFNNIARRLLFGAGATLLVALFLLAAIKPLVSRADTANCVSGTCTITHTTASDFVQGQFYATGLRNVPPGDGEVQLLPVGFTSAWSNETGLTLPRAQMGAVGYKNTLYVIGGAQPFDTSSLATEIFTATTNITGTITAGWTPVDNLPEGRAGAATVIATTQTGGILYVIGGYTDSEAGGSSTIYYKTFNLNGILAAGSWSTATLPAQLQFSAAVVRNSNLYVIGGSEPGVNSQNTIYRFPILNSSGALGTVIQYTMPHSLERLGAVVWEGPTQGFLYILG